MFRVLILVLHLVVVTVIGCNSNILSTGCSDHYCVAIAGCNLTIPCGSLATNHNNNNTLLMVYTIALISSSLQSVLTTFSLPTFLIINTTIFHHNGRILCHADNQLRGEYIINVTYPPMEIELQHVPEPILGRGLTIDCPIKGNPTPLITWTRYSDIDQANILSLSDDITFDNSSWTVNKWTNQLNGFYECCGENVLGQICYHNIITFRLFTEDQCDLIGVKEDGTISIVDDHRDVFDLYDNITIHCTYYSAFMDQPPSWWYLSSDYISNSQHYHTNYSYDNDKCVWSSDLTIKRLSLSLTGTYYCFRGQLNKSIDIELQACYKNMYNNNNTIISIIDRNEHRSIGSNFSMTCQVENSYQFAKPQWCRVDNIKDCIPLSTTNATFIPSTCTWYSTIAFVNLTSQSVATYICFIPNTTLSSESNISIITEQQTTKGSIVIPVSVTVGIIALVLIISSVSAIVIQWSRIIPYSFTKEPSYEYQWDVFISYHSEAEQFVIDHIKCPLEKSLYKVCWHHDDFIAGRTIADNINNAVDNSRKVIILISNSFTTSDHCMMEMDRSLERLQMTHTRCVIPIALQGSMVPKELRSTVTYWSIREMGKNFYENLMKKIGQFETTK